MQKFPTQFLGNSISPTNEVKNLGFTFDSGNTFASHIRICKFLSVETATLLANAMISGRIDYYNSLFYSLNKYYVAKLQKIQNALCRIVFRLDKQAMLLFICKNHIISSFHTVSCSNIILLLQGYPILPTHILLILNKNQ